MMPQVKAIINRREVNSGASFDNLVRAGEQRWRHGEAERVGGLQIDHQLELGRLLNRQIGRPGAFEDLVDQLCRLDILVDEIGAVGDETAGHDVQTVWIDYRE